MFSNINTMQLWHLRLGHISETRLTKLAQHGFIFDLGSETELTFESYILGKMTKSPFVGQGERATELLGLIHTDVVEPINVMAQGGYV